MAVKNQIPKIKLSSSKLETLIQRLERMINEAVEAKSDWEQLHDKYMRMYLAKPASDVRSFPWRGASNLFLPLARVTMDAIQAQFYDAMFSTKPKVIGNEMGDLEAAKKLSRFYFDHVFEKILNLKQIANDSLFDTLLDGTSAMKIRWNRELQLFREQTVVASPITKRDKVTFLGEEIVSEVTVGQESKIVENVLAKRIDRPVIEMSDMARIYVAPGSKESLQWPLCPWYFEEAHLTWDELQRRKRLGYEFDESKLESKLAEHEPTDKESTLNREDHLSDKQPLTARVLTFYMRMSLPGEILMSDGSTFRQQMDENGQDENAYSEDVEVVYLPDIRQVARIIPLSRLSPGGKRPHIDSRYIRIPRHFYGIGIPERLRHLNAMINSTFNQMMDFGTLQNLPFFFYEPATTGLLPNMNPLRPGAGIPVLSSGGVNFPRFQGNHDFFNSMLQHGQRWAERSESVTDFTQGQASQLPNAPRTARGTMALLQQSNIAFSRMVALLAEPFTEMMERVHLLYRKYAPNDIEFSFFNEESGLFRSENLTSEVFQEEINFQFQLNPNRLEEQQTNMMLAQFLMSIPFIAQYPNASRALAKELYESFGKKNFEEIWPESLLQAQASQLGADQFTQGAQPAGPQGLGDLLGGNLDIEEQSTGADVTEDIEEMKVKIG